MTRMDSESSEQSAKNTRVSSEPLLTNSDLNFLLHYRTFFEPRLEKVKPISIRLD
jgi:hypothetical protein